MPIVKKQSSSDQIINYILGEIAERRLKPGDKLMNERDFSEVLGVSRVPLREAVCALSLLGILDARQGEGTFVNRYNSDMLAKIMYIYMTLDNTSIENILEMREIMDIEAAKMAARKCTDENIQEMRDEIAICKKKLRQFNEKTSKVEIFKSIINFHRIIAKATQNKFFTQFMDSIQHSLENYYVMRYEQDQNLFENIERAVEEHSQILEAIATHDENKVNDLLYKHLQFIKVNMNGIKPL